MHASLLLVHVDWYVYAGHDDYKIDCGKLVSPNLETVFVLTVIECGSRIFWKSFVYWLQRLQFNKFIQIYALELVFFTLRLR